MNAQQLKNSILQEAIEGRLVPQDPNDEPASVLLDKIRKEKARLVKEGKLKKKDLEETPISEDEIPFQIPESWEWVSLSQISLDSADGPFGSNLKREHYTNNKEVRIIQLSNIGEEGWRNENVKYTTFSHLPSISRSEAYPEDIIIAKMMPAGRAIICPYGEKKYVLSSDAVRFDFSRLLYRKYLYYAINSQVFKDQVYGEVQGITRVRTSLSKLRTYRIPLPPLAEQKRIVEKIEELQPKVDDYGKAQEALDKLNEELPERLKKSILQEAIEGRLVPQDPNDEPASVLLDKIRKEKAKLVKEGKLKKKDLEETPISEDEIPFEIPKNWEWVRIGNVYKTSSGGTPEKGHPEYYDGDIPWVKVGDLTSLYIDHTEDKISEEGLNSSSAKIFPEDTILLAMYCNDAIGKSSILTKPMTTNQAICGLYPNRYLQQEYVYYAIQSNRRKLQEQSAGGAQKNINQKIVNDLIIPVPPFAEQKRIVAKLEQLLHEIDKLKV